MSTAHSGDSPKTEHSFDDEHLADPGSGVIRAGIFGLSDGLVSNLALIMGVAGGTSSRGAVVLAGIAGLIAGAFSMAAGEFISMQTQREVYQRELRRESRHIEEHPDAEREHLKEILVKSGLDDDVAGRVATEAHQDRKSALDFHARFELGIIPEELGSPFGAAISSFAFFTLGAIIPLLPYFFTASALVISIALSAVALLVVGAVLTRLTGQNPWKGGLRQFAVGAVAAAITFGVGRALGAVV